MQEKFENENPIESQLKTIIKNFYQNLKIGRFRWKLFLNILFFCCSIFVILSWWDTFINVDNFTILELKEYKRFGGKIVKDVDLTWLGIPFIGAILSMLCLTYLNKK